MGDRITDGIIGVIAFALTIVIIGVLLALPTMLLWNMVMPDVFGLTRITFLQALWLSLLSRFLLTGFERGKDNN